MSALVGTLSLSFQISLPSPETHHFVKPTPHGQYPPQAFPPKHPPALGLFARAQLLAVLTLSVISKQDWTSLRAGPL